MSPQIRLALIVCLACLVGVKGQKKEGGNAKRGILMGRHSFSPPLSYKTLLDEWLVSGASLFERYRFLLHPAVPGRSGYLFSKFPIETSSFEIILYFRSKGEKRPDDFNSDQSFAVWYVEEDMAKLYSEKDMIRGTSWKEAMDGAGLTFSGSKAKFKGIGAVLTYSDADNKSKPVISFVTNDGSKELRVGVDAPVKDSKNLDFRNTMNPAQLRIRVTPDTVEGHFKQSNSLAWNECFVIDRKKDAPFVPPSGFIGVTAWSGSRTGVETDLVSIERLEVNNYDENVVGEAMKDVSTKIQDAYREMLTDENRHFLDQKSQMEHLRRLTGLLKEHVSETVPSYREQYRNLVILGERMTKMENDCRTLSTELSILVQPAGRRGAAAIKDHIIGLRRMLVKDHRDHTSKLERVSTNVKKVKDNSDKLVNPQSLITIKEQSERLEKSVKAKSSQSTYMFLMLMGSVVGIGALIYNRMYYYEKKHFV